MIFPSPTSPNSLTTTSHLTHFAPTKLNYLVFKIHYGAVTTLCIYPSCYLSTTSPVNQSFPFLFIQFFYYYIKIFIQQIFTEYFYVPETVLDTGDPLLNYGLSPHSDGIYNLMRTKDTKWLIISVIKDYKG